MEAMPAPISAAEATAEAAANLQRQREELRRQQLLLDRERRALDDALAARLRSLGLQHQQQDAAGTGSSLSMMFPSASAASPAAAGPRRFSAGDLPTLQRHLAARAAAAASGPISPHSPAPTPSSPSSPSSPQYPRGHRRRVSFHDVVVVGYTHPGGEYDRTSIAVAPLSPADVRSVVTLRAQMRRETGALEASRGLRERVLTRAAAVAAEASVAAATGGAMDPSGGISSPMLPPPLLVVAPPKTPSSPPMLEDRTSASPPPARRPSPLRHVLRADAPAFEPSSAVLSPPAPGLLERDPAASPASPVTDMDSPGGCGSSGGRGSLELDYDGDNVDSPSSPSPAQRVQTPSSPWDAGCFAAMPQRTAAWPGFATAVGRSWSAESWSHPHPSSAAFAAWPPAWHAAAGKPAPALAAPTLHAPPPLFVAPRPQYATATAWHEDHPGSATMAATAGAWGFPVGATLTYGSPRAVPSAPAAATADGVLATAASPLPPPCALWATDATARGQGWSA
ncbi:hypothetical protein HK405_011002, partial [Cladochytrium tenue]